MAQWTRSGTCSGTRLLCPRRAAPPTWLLSSVISPSRGSTRTRVVAQQAKAISTRVSCMPPEQWKVVYRAFLLHVHPDFFHDQPEERAMNEKNLMIFQQHLHRLDHHGPAHAANAATARGGGTLGNGSARLVFFLKPGAEQVDANGKGHIGKENTFDASNVNSIESVDRPLPRKVILPLQSRRKMAHLLHEAGITPTSAPAPSPPSPLRHRPSRSDPTRPTDAIPEWEVWAEDLFGGTAANRAWDEAAAMQRKSRRQAHVEDDSSEGRQRTTEGGVASEEHRQGGAWTLGHVLATDAGRRLVRERRASARNVRRLVNELRAQHGFGEFTFRCGWSKANLCMALSSLLEACNAHREAFRVPNFGGLEVVFRNDPSMLHKGEIRLCPADVPLEWISVLGGVTPLLLSDVEDCAREVRLLEEQASAILRGARLSRGLSCSKSRYHEFLGNVCMAGADLGGDESSMDVSPSDWSVLRCKVEEGFGRASKVLEDGTIQIGSDMTLGTLLQCLGRDFAGSSTIITESARLAATADAIAARCRQSLGLEAIDRARAVSVAQMVTACTALLRLIEDGSRGREAEAVAARRRLRGHYVRVVGTRLGVFDGVTEDGEIAIPWNWAGEKG